MKVPLEITFRNISNNITIESLIRSKIQKLEKINDNIISCHTVVEMPQKDIKGGNLFRVRISLRIPRSPEIVVTREPGKGKNHEKLDTAIRDSFERMYRQLKSATELKRKNVKVHSLHRNFDSGREIDGRMKL